VRDQPDEAFAWSAFFATALRLKSLQRTGWLDRGIPSSIAESVADHSYQAALMAWVISLDDPELDADRVLKLALVHDLPEALIGDITPYDPSQIPDRAADYDAWKNFLDRRQSRNDERKAAKQAAEQVAMGQMIRQLPAESQSVLADLWRELERGETPEALFVKQVDKLETWLQSRAYHDDFPDAPLESFAAEIDEVIIHPALRAFRDRIIGS
jgi:putative hydrolase of HD superfamily